MRSKFESDGLSNKYQLNFSTMSGYFGSVFDDANKFGVYWTEEKGDFWAYNGVDATWTGYFSTNPEIKRQITHYSDFVQSATQIMGAFPSEQAEESLIEV